LQTRRQKWMDNVQGHMCYELQGDGDFEKFTAELAAVFVRDKMRLGHVARFYVAIFLMGYCRSP